MRREVQITTPDGTAAATVHLPDGEGPWPGVVMFPDAFGFRETFREMGDTLAASGFVTLVPDLYYRSPGWAPFDPATAFGDPDERARLGALMGSLIDDPGRVIADVHAYVDFLLALPEVDGAAVGTTGYCMGGWISLTAAGELGAKIAAAASFHGGKLAVEDDPVSPHLAAGRISATVYVAGAEEDDSFTPEQADLLDRALTDAGVEHTVEFYSARHGFAVRDNATHDAAAEARHWGALGTLYGGTLLKS
ncbi:dienelactone hydrolase family protein [Actinokineospora pegani]|uniref:dienelactone hydrolase family protein n=1 Tax=Actinokineospora pegani TaxID=2654637 RepID=UPI0012EA5D5C|nr:dienelactone hydrolase family protein [Actinokineospora pegani]